MKSAAKQHYNFRNSGDNNNSGTINAGNVTTFISTEQQAAYGLAQPEPDLNSCVLDFMARIKALEEQVLNLQVQLNEQSTNGGSN